MEEQLLAEDNPISSLVVSLRLKAEKAHNIVRRTSRILFPVRMHETGLILAINELVSGLSDLKQIHIDAKVNGEFGDMPDNLALALYRICHESAMCAITDLNANNIHLDICAQKTCYQMALQQDGMPWKISQDSKEWQLILYRLQSIGGTFAIDERNDITYQIPQVV